MIQIEPLMTTEDLAEYLNRPVKWVRMNAHEIPHQKVGREYRFRLAEVDAWLEASRGGTPLRYLKAA